MFSTPFIVNRDSGAVKQIILRLYVRAVDMKIPSVTKLLQSRLQFTISVRSPRVYPSAT